MKENIKLVCIFKVQSMSYISEELYIKVISWKQIYNFWRCLWWADPGWTQGADQNINTSIFSWTVKKKYKSHG